MRIVRGREFVVSVSSTIGEKARFQPVIFQPKLKKHTIEELKTLSKIGRNTRKNKPELEKKLKKF